MNLTEYDSESHNLSYTHIPDQSISEHNLAS